MKSFIRVFSLVLAMLALCACAAGTAEDSITTAAPTTTATPTESTNSYFRVLTRSTLSEHSRSLRKTDVRKGRTC